MAVATAVRLKPLGDRVLVKALDKKEETRSGIIIPETAKEKPQEGEVLAVGPGKFEEGKISPMYVKAGDKVLYGKYAGQELKVDGQEYLIMHQDDILGIVEG
jgi:chaperonin GroES